MTKNISTRLKISNYIDNLINELDIHIEEIILSNIENEKLKVDLDDLRKIYIDELIKIRDMNLKICDTQRQQLNENMVNDGELDESLTKHYCYFLNKNSYFKFPVEYKHGILVVTDWALTVEELSFVEYVSFTLLFILYYTIFNV